MPHLPFVALLDQDGVALARDRVKVAQAADAIGTTFHLLVSTLGWLPAPRSAVHGRHGKVMVASASCSLPSISSASRHPCAAARPRGLPSRTWARFSAVVRAAEPPQERQRERLLADQPLECGDPRLLHLHQVGRPGIFRGPHGSKLAWGDIVEGAGLVFVDPGMDRVAGDVVTLRQTVQGVAGQKLLRDLPPELDAVGSVSRHGFHPSKAQPTSSIHSAPTVQPEASTP